MRVTIRYRCTVCGYGRRIWSGPHDLSTLGAAEAAVDGGAVLRCRCRPPREHRDYRILLLVDGELARDQDAESFLRSPPPELGAPRLYG